MEKFRLSKSKYCMGVQCPRLLWLKENKPELFDSSVIDQAVLNNGNEVGDLAMGLFGDYVEVPYDKDLTKMISETERLMNEGVGIICEASFSYDGLFCSVDILKNLGDGHVEIYEVKSSTHFNEIYDDDIAFQNYLLTNLGYKVDGVYLVHINKEYVRHGDLDLQELFKIVDMKSDAEFLYDMVGRRIAGLRECMEKTEEPSMYIGGQCISSNNRCGFWCHCTEHLPSPNIFDLAGLGIETKLNYLVKEKVSFEELLAENKLNAKCIQQMRHELEDLPAEIDLESIRGFLGTLSYPMYFLDFESFAPAVPRFDETKPYMQICFQYSLHYIEHEGGELKHKEFLAYPGDDPRRALCEQLCRDIPKDVCVLAYNKGFECARIREMAELYPDLREHLLNIRDNIKDLMSPFQGRKYYCRAMKGSYSIKYVLPALYPDDPSLDYHNLEGVHNGGEASATFLRMSDMNPEELEEYRGHLLKYCGLDTYAMVKVWEKLKEAV